MEQFPRVALGEIINDDKDTGRCKDCGNPIWTSRKKARSMICRVCHTLGKIKPVIQISRKELDKINEYRIKKAYENYMKERNGNAGGRRT